MAANLRKPPFRNARINRTTLFSILAFVMIVWHVFTQPDWQQRQQGSDSVSNTRTLHDPLAFDATSNADEVKKWRRRTLELCTPSAAVDDLARLRTHFFDAFVPPSTTPYDAQPRGNAGAKRCKHVVMDFGANIGDTSGKVIDFGLRGCDQKVGDPAMSNPRFNVTSLQFEFSAIKRNILTTRIGKLMHEIGRHVGPEDYCYYGIEGNPVFTDRLHKLADFVMGMRPRPIQHLHFFTESVGAGQDGITKLYLDTVNGAHNFWGSSIFQSHGDVVKSAQQAGKSIDDASLAATVMGYTIGTLMRKTLLAFAPDGTDSERFGGASHLLLKVDIEGGEYSLLQQAATDPTLCDFVRTGNRVDLFVEWHSQRVTGKNPLAGNAMTQYTQKLMQCGVNFHPLSGWWA